MDQEKRNREMDEAKALYLRCQLDRAFPIFQKYAQAGDGEAMYFLGEYYSQGYGHVEQDTKRGAEWRKKGAIAGDVLAQLNTAYNLPGDDPGRQAIPKVVFPEILRRAEAGDVFAQNELPDMYYYGIGTEKNVDKAVEWLEKAGANGFWRPLNKLGEMYYYGEGVPADEDKAAAYFEKAAALGYGDAEANLAMCCYAGKKKNLTRAVSLLRRAFAHGALFARDAANILGIFLLEGKGVKKDEKEAFEWLKRSAELGSPAGMNHLAVCYERGIGTAPNEAKAEEWCRRAADLGHAEAAVQYGIYQREKGHNKLAMRYFRQSAEMGNADGQTWLASCFLFGIGAKEDREEARKWLEKAAAQQNENAVKLLKEELGIDWKGTEK